MTDEFDAKPIGGDDQSDALLQNSESQQSWQIAIADPQNSGRRRLPWRSVTVCLGQTATSGIICSAGTRGLNLEGLRTLFKPMPLLTAATPAARCLT
ncbi:hypothetical protein KCP73_15280 [Salmonella enterica subsp. enterica]|nr:hypothetical protein KCP73_15280 [Salmonella enterica subsp. enterica]